MPPKWLLDENVPKRLTLGEFGIVAHTAEARGWKGLTNGELVEAAVRAGFTCVLARDRLFSESAARALRRFPQFCVVLITIPQLRGPEFMKQFRLAWARDPLQPAPRKRIQWPVEL